MSARCKRTYALFAVQPSVAAFSAPDNSSKREPDDFAITLMQSRNTAPHRRVLAFAFALVKLLLPLRPVRVVVDRILNALATAWVACNSGWMRLTQRAHWDVAGVDGLEYRGWYLVNCNHQSWVDIVVLQHLLNRRIPILKFFLKQQLIYVPVIGLAWWALDFPFMRRHSDAYLRAHPDRRLEDLKVARVACRKFSLVPTCVMNFAEGTRFTRLR